MPLLEAPCNRTGCRVHQLTKLGDRLGFGVFILPEDLRVFSQLMARPGAGIRWPPCPSRSGPAQLPRYVV